MQREVDKACRSEEMLIGNTLFTVISMQSENARESVDSKLKRLILNHAESTKHYPATEQK